MSQLDTVPTDFAPAIGIAPAEGLESEEGGVLEGLPNTRDLSLIHISEPTRPY